METVLIPLRITYYFCSIRQNLLLHSVPSLITKAVKIARQFL